MTLTHHERVGKALGLLREGLRPFVERQLKAQYGETWNGRVRDILADTRLSGGKGDATYDVAALLVIMDRTWGEIFRRGLGRAERSLVNELMDIRNRWAHQAHFLPDDAYRALDTAGRLLAAVSATEADDVEKMKVELLQLRFDERARNERAPARMAGGSEHADHLKHRCEIVSPRNLSPAGKPGSDRFVASGMSQADRIRRFVFDRYIAPARASGRTEVTIRAGDVHKEMRLISAMPAVCSAVGGSKFGDLAGVTMIERKGPPNGANVYFRFGVSVPPMAIQPTFPQPEPVLKPPPDRTTRDLDLSNALVLIACVKSKLPRAAPARELYTSPLFRKARDIAEASGACWFLLSAKYGLISPDEVIEPYEYTLNTLGITERSAWAAKVLKKLLPVASSYKRVVFFAGARYREFLIEPLKRRGLTVEIPMEHFAFGEQLAWLSEYE